MFCTLAKMTLRYGLSNGFSSMLCSSINLYTVDDNVPGDATWCELNPSLKPPLITKPITKPISKPMTLHTTFQEHPQAWTRVDTIFFEKENVFFSGASAGLDARGHYFGDDTVRPEQILCKLNPAPENLHPKPEQFFPSSHFSMLHD